MRYDLCREKWRLKGYYPWVPVKDKSMETGKELMGVTDWLPATVPGGVHYDLYRAGWIEHPYQDLNSLKCEWVENRWWEYRAEVQPPREEALGYRLVFEGLDYDASIYVNGRLLATHQGMYEPVAVDITQAVQDARESGQALAIKVLLRHAPDEMGQIGKTSLTFTQKSRFNYKWDFSTRLVNLGIWQPCYIESLSECGLRYPRIHTTVDAQGRGEVRFQAELERRAPCNAHVRFTLEETGDTVLIPCQGEGLDGQLTIEQPRLWQPNGAGEQPLYHALAVLEDEAGRELDRWQGRVGIRKLSYRQNEGAPADALPYTFVVNDQPLYIKGVNMTPLDHLYGNISDEHYRVMVQRMKRMNVNMVRVWGGGLIEQERFYELCDEAGILVWQEFIQSSSGIGNVPSKKPEFLTLLRQTALHAVRTRCNHACLAVWSGGNELNDENDRPATYEDENIAMLKAIVEAWDSQRLFLPTSASGPREFVSEDKGVSHDIHGNWNYGGNPYHYRLYGRSDSLFHSEFGTDGMCCAESLQRFVSPPYRTLAPVDKNIVYRHHGEWWCTFRRDEALFGPCDSLRQMTLRSQWIQAEGLRFILEANRRRAMRNSGSIIWQINEPWPNASCTSLVDYYLNPKMAWYWCKEAFAPFHVSLDYQRLDAQAGAPFPAAVHLHWDGGFTGQARVRVRAFTAAGQCFAEQLLEGHAQTNHSWRAGSAELLLPGDLSGLFMVRLDAEDEQCRQSRGEYWFGCGAGPVYGSVWRQPSAVLTQRLVSESAGEQVWQVLNQSRDAVAMFVHPRCDEDFLALCDRAYFCLLPGEAQEVRLAWRPRFASALLDTKCGREQPEFVFEDLLSGEEQR